MTTTPDERTDLIHSLDKQRGFIRHTVRGLSDEQAGKRTTPSQLCLGGIIKHVAITEERWLDFIEHGPVVMEFSPEAMHFHADSFRMLEGETLAAILERYGQVASRTTTMITELPSLDQSQPLPEAPWFEPGVRWSARQVFLHILAETAQHSGHADIIREALDGAKTMG